MMNLADIKKWGLARLSAAQKSHSGVATVNSSGQVCGPSGSPVEWGGTALLTAAQVSASATKFIASKDDGTPVKPDGTVLSVSGGGSSSGKAIGMAARAAVAISRKGAAPVLDGLSATAMACWGFVKLRSAYSGNCIKVRRASDNATLDIGFLPDGIVNTALMIAFCGSSTLYADTIYDQSGSGFNITQATAANQPRIDLTFLRNGMPAIVLENTHNTMSIPSGVAITSTANCAVWNAIGTYSNRLSTRLFNLGTDKQFSLDLTPISAFSVQPGVNGSLLNFSAGMATIPNVNGCVVGLNSSGTNMTFYRNDYSTTRATVTAIATTGGTLGWSTNGGGLDWYGGAVFNAALTAEDAQLIQYGMTAAYSCVQTPVQQVVLCGDSIVASAVAFSHNYAKCLSYYLGDNIALYNVGLGGQYLQTEASEVSSYITPLYKSGMVNVCVLLGGVNDISVGLRTGAQLIADATTWHTATKAAGYKSLQAVLFPRAITGGYTNAMETERVTFNAWVRANSGSGKIADGLVDFELEPTFLPKITTADFPDNLHPNLRGYRKAAPIIADAVIAQMHGA